MAPGNRIAVGIDVGGTKILAGVVREDGTVLAEARVSSTDRPETLLPALREALTGALEKAGAVTVDAIGVALPGLVDRHDVLHAAPNLGASDRGLDLRRAFDAALRNDAAGGGDPQRIRLAFANDANCAAFAEFAVGAARGTSHAVVVSLGTGIGGGVISDGKLLRGARSFAGEVGHVVVERDGVPCPCGRRGCWERYASGSGLSNLAREAVAKGGGEAILELAGSAEEIVGEHVTAAARAGDPLALQVIGSYAEWVALGLANLVELFDPERFVIGGGLVREVDLFLDTTRQAYLRACRASQERSADDIVPAHLGEEAASVGAALVALDGPA